MDSTKTRITTFTDSMYLYCFNSRQLFFFHETSDSSSIFFLLDILKIRYGQLL